MGKSAQAMVHVSASPFEAEDLVLCATKRSYEKFFECTSLIHGRFGSVC